MGREQSLSSRDFIKAEDGQLEVAAAKTGEPEDDDGHHVDAGGRGGKSEEQQNIWDLVCLLYTSDAADE